MYLQDEIRLPRHTVTLRHLRNILHTVSEGLYPLVALAHELHVDIHRETQVQLLRVEHRHILLYVPLVLETLHPLVDRGCREINLSSQLLGGEPRVFLKLAEYFFIYLVKIIHGENFSVSKSILGPADCVCSDSRGEFSKNIQTYKMYCI